MSVLFLTSPFLPHLSLCLWGNFWKGWGLLPEESTLKIVLESWTSLPDFWGGKRSWRLNQSPMTNEFISYAYIMKLPLKLPFKKKKKRGSSECFQAGKPEYFHVPLCWAQNSMGTEILLLRTSPYLFIHMAVYSYPLIFFYKMPIIW